MVRSILRIRNIIIKYLLLSPWVSLLVKTSFFIFPTDTGHQYKEHTRLQQDISYPLRSDPAIPVQQDQWWRTVEMSREGGVVVVWCGPVCGLWSVVCTGDATGRLMKGETNLKWLSRQTELSSVRINWREWLSVQSPPPLMSTTTTTITLQDTSDLCPLHLIVSPQLLIADWGLKRQTLEKSLLRPSLFHQRRKNTILKM